jgi:mono/diheme cytochrome c family protein
MEEGHMFCTRIIIIPLILIGSVGVAGAQPVRDPQRGELLYSTHCIACHNSEIHWRDRKLAKDIKSLSAQVYRWQQLAGLGWNNDDISAVTSYLNTLYYHYPVPY